MFHWSIYTTYNATQFVLTVPVHYMMLLISVPALLVVLTFGLKAGHPWRNGGLVLLILFAYSLFTSCSRLTLDKSTGKATLREFTFFHWRESTYDLGRIERVYVATGNQNDQLRLQFKDGAVRSISDRDQYGGKNEAAAAANVFLGVSAAAE